MTAEWQESLLAEKSLWQVFKRSPTFWKRKTNALIILLSICISLLVSALDTYAFYNKDAPSFALDSAINLLAKTGKDYSLTMLGFLLAGFTIFATITKPELFIELAEVPKDKKTSQLQFIFFSFIGVFVHYLCFLSLCLIIHIGITDDGILSQLYTTLFSPSALHLFSLYQLGFWLLTIWFTIAVVVLKSFVWNLYQIFLLSIVTEADRLRALQEEADRLLACQEEITRLQALQKNG